MHAHSHSHLQTPGRRNTANTARPAVAGSHPTPSRVAPTTPRRNYFPLSTTAVFVGQVAGETHRAAVWAAAKGARHAPSCADGRSR